MSQSCHISPRLPTSGFWFLLLEKNKTPLLFESLFWGPYYSQLLTPRPITVYSLCSSQRPFKSVKPGHITSIPSHLNLGSLPGQSGFLWSRFSISPSLSPIKSLYYFSIHHLHTQLQPHYLEWAKLLSVSGPLLFLLPGQLFTLIPLLGLLPHVLACNSNAAFSERPSLITLTKSIFVSPQVSLPFPLTLLILLY